MENRMDVENILAAAYLSGAAEALKKTADWPHDQISKQIEDIKDLRRKFLARSETDGYTKPVHHIEEAKERAYLLLTGQPEPVKSSLTPPPANISRTVQMTNSIKNMTQHINSLAQTYTPAPAALAPAVSLIDAAKNFLFPPKTNTVVAPTAAATVAPTVAATVAATVAPTVAATVAPTVAATVPQTVSPLVEATAPTLAQTSLSSNITGKVNSPNSSNSTVLNAGVERNINTTNNSTNNSTNNRTNNRTNNSNNSTNTTNNNKNNNNKNNNNKNNSTNNRNTSNSNNNKNNNINDDTPTLPPLLQLGGKKRKTYRKRR